MTKKLLANSLKHIKKELRSLFIGLLINCLALKMLISELMVKSLMHLKTRKQKENYSVYLEDVLSHPGNRDQVSVSLPGSSQPEEVRTH